jgi:hypothetical protein
MIIPHEFIEVLDRNRHLSGIVRSTVSRYDSIIRERNFEFFQEYTKHDVSHLETVLMTARNLIGKSLSLLMIKTLRY